MFTYRIRAFKSLYSELMVLSTQKRVLSQYVTPITSIVTATDDTHAKGVFPEFSPAKGDKVDNLVNTTLDTPRSTTLADLVKYSSDLQRLIALGVSLRDVESKEGAAELVANIKYYPQVDEVVTLLRAVGVERIGDVISRCPFLLAEGAESLRLKLMYLSSRRFSRTQITRLVTTQPCWLLEGLTEVDAKLAAVKQIFQLSNGELRDVVSRSPKVALLDTLLLQRFKVILNAAYDLEPLQIKALVIGCPSATRIGERNLRQRMDYLTETMHLSKEQILAWPSILRCRQRIVKERHSVLSHLNLHEYDSSKPGYVSLQRLVSGTDENFCKDVAKIPLNLYYDYIKTF
ncbi:transcription termination factor 3, mitochondrial-like [Watersipora subatra]|uniref:transcription termination factor 3, mitochondrial-like n=1 Tax=Watersipora subatra TaxID=2589382 RepID=UPI00355B96D2